VRFLIHEGADPNYVCSNGPSLFEGVIFTPLSAAICRKETDTELVLLESGADILAPIAVRGSLSEYAARHGMAELANTLHTIECEEMAKRNLTEIPSTYVDTA
jgi:hypothetical protein